MASLFDSEDEIEQMLDVSNDISNICILIIFVNFNYSLKKKIKKNKISKQLKISKNQISLIRLYRTQTMKILMKTQNFFSNKFEKPEEGTFSIMIEVTRIYIQVTLIKLLRMQSHQRSAKCSVLLTSKNAASVDL